MLEQVYVAHVECSHRGMVKINNKHGLTLGEVREAILHPARPRRAASDWDSDRGSRLVAECVTRTEVRRRSPSVKHRQEAQHAIEQRVFRANYFLKCRVEQQQGGRLIAIGCTPTVWPPGTGGRTVRPLCNHRNHFPR